MRAIAVLLASGAHFCISGLAAETRICSCWGAYEHSQHRTCAKTKMLAADLQQNSGKAGHATRLR